MHIPLNHKGSEDIRKLVKEERDWRNKDQKVGRCSEEKIRQHSIEVVKTWGCELHGE